MSLRIDIKTPNKQEISQVLRSVANLIEISTNKTVTINLSVEWNSAKA